MSKGPNEGKKPEAQSAQSHDQSAPTAAKGKGGAGVAGACLAAGCKHDGKQFGFCAEHYDHFKFGLIKKTGEQVPDYEKKYGHFMAHKAKRAHKVA